jgi:DHA1 family tetracycline resistance protein-like MFS transporter
MQFLFSPLVGSLSDRFGRRPVLLTSLTVMALVVALVLFRRVRINPAHVD